MKKLIFFTLVIVILGALYLYTEIYTRGVTNKYRQPQGSIEKVESNIVSMDQEGRDVLKKRTSTEETNTSDSPGQEVVDIVQENDTVTEKKFTTFDWQNDESPDKRPSQKDPFGDLIAEQQAKERGTWIGDPETMDLDELHSATYNQLLERFGDIPQVHTYMEYSRDASNSVPLTIDEEIAGLEAMNYLFPSGSTRRTLAFFKWMKTNGGYNASDQGVAVKELRDLGITVEIIEENGGTGYVISTE